MDLFAIFGKKIDGQFGPLGDGLVGAEFHAVLTDADRGWGKGQTGLRAVDLKPLKDARCVEFASAHIGWVQLTTGQTPVNASGEKSFSGHPTAVQARQGTADI